MQKWLILGCVMMGLSVVTAAETFDVREVESSLDGKSYLSTVVLPKSKTQVPGVLMVPNWMGVTPAAVEKAKRVSKESGAAVYIADVYGRDIRPANPAEAGALAGELKNNPAELAKRTRAATEHFQSLAPQLSVNPEAMAAIGFCFGGTAILELARTGMPLKAFVSFHGGLGSATLDDSDKILGSVLVLHGANDPFVPPAEVAAFEEAMRKTQVDWQLVSYGGAVHSFTDPNANQPGKSMYDARTADRAFQAMKDLFQEVL